MTYYELREWLAEVSYKDWRITFGGGGLRPYLQVVGAGTCNVTGAPIQWSGRKWFLSTHMVKSEVIQTAFKAVLTAEEHEARENFKYKGVTIFDPHYDVDKLVALRSQPDALDERIEDEI